MHEVQTYWVLSIIDDIGAVPAGVVCVFGRHWGATAPYLAAKNIIIALWEYHKKKITVESCTDKWAYGILTFFSVALSFTQKSDQTDIRMKLDLWTSEPHHEKRETNEKLPM